MQWTYLKSRSQYLKSQSPAKWLRNLPLKPTTLWSHHIPPFAFHGGQDMGTSSEGLRGQFFWDKWLLRCLGIGCIWAILDTYLHLGSCCFIFFQKKSYPRLCNKNTSKKLQAYAKCVYPQPMKPHGFTSIGELKGEVFARSPNFQQVSFQSLLFKTPAWGIEGWSEYFSIRIKNKHIIYNPYTTLKKLEQNHQDSK